MVERLQKVLSSAGLGSRRACEQLILDGHVRVNGQLIRDLPVLVEDSDRVEVDGKPIRREKKAYYLLHKPRGVIVSNSDPSGRTRAIDLLVGVGERVFPVGRLDLESSGLLLLTNDGELANRLTHPRYEAPKIYEAQVDGSVSGEAIAKLLEGVYLAEGKTRADRIRVLARSHRQSLLSITLTEGRNRQIRRMLARMGHKVRKLKRVAIGKLTTRGLGVGRFRKLTADEVSYLKRLAGLAGPAGEASAGPIGRGSARKQARPTGRRVRPGDPKSHARRRPARPSKDD